MFCWPSTRLEMPCICPGWSKSDQLGINVGSSRGATALFETYHKQFIREGKSATLTSPTTTLGNISSWIGHDLKNKRARYISFHNLLNFITCIAQCMRLAQIGHGKQIHGRRKRSFSHAVYDFPNAGFENICSKSGRGEEKQ